MAVRSRTPRDRMIRTVVMIHEASDAAPAVILIVEDEPLLRELAVEIVEDAGFVALEACNAEQAVAVLEGRADVTVLFTDVNMPGGMDGLKLAHAVRDRWPPIKILIASGQVQLQQCDLPSDCAFLGKPYRGETMIARLRSLVGRTGLWSGTEFSRKGRL
jgi:two-component system, response regulator PdtaR